MFFVPSNVASIGGRLDRQAVRFIFGEELEMPFFEKESLAVDGAPLISYRQPVDEASCDGIIL